MSQPGEAQQRIDALRGRIEDILAQQQTFHDELQRVAEEVQTHGTDLAEVETAIAAAITVAASREQDVATSEEQLRAAELRTTDRISALRTIEIQLVRLQGEIQTLTSDESRLANQSLTIDQRREQRTQDRKHLVSLDFGHLVSLSIRSMSVNLNILSTC